MDTTLKAGILDAVLVARPVVVAVKDLFESYRTECNNYLRKSGYIAPNTNKPIELADIRIGIDPTQKIINVFPSILITLAGTQVEWEASRITRETVSARIFCCVQNPVNEQLEMLMYDLTDFCKAVLIAHQVLPFYLEQDDSRGKPTAELHAPSVSSTQVSYGNIMADHVRAGQIDWSAEILLARQNLMFGYVTDE